jgi:DNA-binding CsgD family transcriptional regulator
MYKIKPLGRRLFNSLTETEKKEIAQRQAGGETQVALALAFQCGPGVIRRACKDAGVGRWLTLTPELEREAVRLMRGGLQQEKTARRLRLSGTVVHELYLKHGIDPHRGAKLRGEKLKRVIEAVAEGKKYCKQIGSELGVDRNCVRKYAHQVRGEEPFIGGNRVPPMTQRNSESLVDSNFQSFSMVLSIKEPKA